MRSFARPFLSAPHRSPFIAQQTLDQTNAALQVAQEQRSSTPDVDTVAEIAQLHAHVEELNKALSDATRDSYEAHEAKKQVEESVRFVPLLSPESS